MGFGKTHRGRCLRIFLHAFFPYALKWLTRSIRLGVLLLFQSKLETGNPYRSVSQCIVCITTSVFKRFLIPSLTCSQTLSSTASYTLTSSTIDKPHPMLYFIIFMYIIHDIIYYIFVYVWYIIYVMLYIIYIHYIIYIIYYII